MPEKKLINDKSVFNIRYEVLVCLFLILATISVYGQVRNHAFTNYDDGCYVAESRQVQDGISMKNIWWALTATKCGNWHPLTWLSHMLDYALYGLDSGQHHMTSVLFHILNTLLLFFVFMRMTGILWRSAFIAALFALHPLHVESVAWVAERKDVLSAFFWMLTMWSYIRYAERPGFNRYLAVLIFFTLGLMSKPMLVTLPLVLLLIDFWPLQRISFGRTEGSSVMPWAAFLRLIKEKVPLFVLAGASSVVTIAVQQKGGSIGSLDAIPLYARIANAAVSYAQYAGKAFWPQSLAAFYPHPGTPPWWQVGGACLIILLVTVLAIRNLKTHPYLAVGWAWFLGTLVPVIGLVQVGLQAMADRYTYIPLIGVFVMIVWGGAEFRARRGFKRYIVGFPAAAILLILMTVTYRQVGYWRNSMTLFNHTLAATIANPVAHNNLGHALDKQGRQDEAMKHYYEALQIKPDYDDAHNNLAVVFVKQGRLKEGIKHYKEALRINPDCLEAHFNLAQALAEDGKWAESLTHYHEVLRLDPSDVEAYNNAGLILERMGRSADAIRYYSEALQKDPGFAETHDNLGNALVALGKLDEAVDSYTEALRLNPDSAKVHNNLGVALLRKGMRDAAIVHFREAVRKKPDYAIARNNLEKALVDQ